MQECGAERRKVGVQSADDDCEADLTCQRHRYNMNANVSNVCGNTDKFWRLSLLIISIISPSKHEWNSDFQLFSLIRKKASVLCSRIAACSNIIARTDRKAPVPA